jgi:gamma-glutamylcyclotransferase (GGCT)/AIG2-like uncharacterized protein YtfP
MLYFGYGSNLDSADLARFCRERGGDPILLERKGQAFLPDRRLAFTHRSSTRAGGVLDVPPARGCAVSGVLFRVLSDESIAALDRKESEGHVYRRFETVALTDAGAEAAVFTYEVPPSHRERFVPPASAYLDVVRRGYESHGIATEPLEAAAAGQSQAGPILGLFVYGTLRRGEERHPVLMRHDVRGGDRATTTGTLLDLGPYPGLVVDDPRGSVAGEVYVADDPDRLLAELDGIEDFRGFGSPGSLYRRALVRVRHAETASTLVWTYVYAGSRSGSRLIPSGDWFDREDP